MPPRPNCTICSSAFVAEINGLLAQGRSSAAIAREMPGFSVATIRDHRIACLGTAEMGEKSGRPVTPKDVPVDFAVAVRDKALAQLKEGKLKVNSRDGLNAQALIDRREERSEDRKFMLNLARVLSGGGAPAPVDVIEATYTELPLLEAPSPLLAPPELREDPAKAAS